MNFPGTNAGLPADLTLIVQTAAFIILLFGVIHAKKKKIFKSATAAMIRAPEKVSAVNACNIT